MSPFPTPVTTERLRLERLSPDAVDPRELYEICAHDDGIDEVAEHLGWSPHAHPKETVEFVAGAAALHVDWERRRAELGTWLRRRFWGREYSGERAHALMSVAFERLDLAVVAARCCVENERSRRAVEKYVDAADGRHEGRIANDATDGEAPRDVGRHAVRREAWRDSEASDRPVDYPA